MQKWKKFLATLTAGALCAVALPLAKLELPEVVMNAAAAECTVPVGTGTTTLTYEVQEDDTVEITDCEDTAAGELEIPAEIDGKAVTRIGDMAFNDKEYLTGITVPDSVKTIGDKAFTDCISAAYINLPQEMDSFGVEVFNSCYALEEITIPEGITGLLPRVEKIEEGNDVLYGFFAYCTALKKVVLPSTLKTIDESVFYNCPALESIEIPNGVTEIKRFAFEKCESLVSVEIPKSVTSIGDWAFESCTSLESITIPDSVTSIGDGAFVCCSSLKNITIPDSVTNIGEEAFNSCSSLESIAIPEGITALPARADDSNYGSYYGFLAFCTSLKEVKLPSTLKSIDEAAFYECSSLESIEIPEGVEQIKQFAFDGCFNLKEITIPGSVKSIEGYAFWACESLKSIFIPSSVTYIGGYAFSYSGLTDVYYDGTKEQWNAIEIVNNANEYPNNSLLIYATKHFSDGTQATSTGDLDGNGTVDTNDVFEAMLYVAYRGAGMSGGLRAEQITAADIDGDGSVDSTDVYYILYYVALQGAGKKPTWDSVLGR